MVYRLVKTKRQGGLHPRAIRDVVTFALRNPPTLMHLPNGWSNVGRLTVHRQSTVMIQGLLQEIKRRLVFSAFHK